MVGGERKKRENINKRNETPKSGSNSLHFVFLSSHVHCRTYPNPSPLPNKTNPLSPSLTIFHSFSFSDFLSLSFFFFALSDRVSTSFYLQSFSCIPVFKLHKLKFRFSSLLGLSFLLSLEGFGARNGADLTSRGFLSCTHVKALFF